MDRRALAERIALFARGALALFTSVRIFMGPTDRPALLFAPFVALAVGAGL